MYPKRALRRWQQQVKNKKVVEILNQRWYNYTKNNVYQKTNRLVNNFTMCSCYMCRNPRRNDWQSNEERLTIQERRNNDIFELWKNRQT